ncbi:hypothetical protein ACIQ57_08725 [Lysinibacillus xylanilyticus]|uniref:hypothetical protein n=1 Tax=Lysinibacillus xylanilyticus TaxID=582475 RepID=UPI0038105B88
MLDFVSDLLSGILFNGSTTLDTNKIDKNIEKLQHYNWFNEIYHDDKYRKLFFANRNVRNYLQNNFRVKKMIKKTQAQKRFIYFLNKQLK